MISSASSASAARSRVSISPATTPISTLSRYAPHLYRTHPTAKDRPITTDPPRRTQRLHGRLDREAPCDHVGCPNPGEFRAPRSNRAPGSDAGWQFLCLEHVRAFNIGYNFFDGLSPDEIYEAQSPLAGWERAASPRGREAFTFGDAHDLFTTESRPRPPVRKWSGFGDPQALGALGLDDTATAIDIRRAYKRLVRRYHPDSNGGDRAQEGKLQAVVNAYTHLKSASAFKSES
ncbi:molecular chaperone DnaJ [Polymorphobacter glacialis]|uniref:Molecular chaperone DnaJ n=1 Tax=Sandarakinorhabdus glacialis TaxID=1614636 RepID=A0A916ZYH9_9SPHN|nr:J domain-containing protein [Polymorphobacter glacialis]GGE19021.1 molecular chaperone DnaJ [Polymorphobacter glacialis]